MMNLGKSLLFSISAILIFSCSTNNASRTPASSDVLANEWIQSYKEAQKISHISSKKGCELYKKLKSKKSPFSETAQLLELRTKQTCDSSQYHLEKTEKWLKKDGIFYGLRHSSKNPVAFVKYYKEYQDLDYLERLEFEFLERERLSRQALTAAKAKGNQKAIDEIRDFMPLFYVLDKKSTPEDKKFDAAYGLRMTRNFSKAKSMYRSIIADGKGAYNSSKNKKDKIKAFQQTAKAYEYLRVCYRVEENKAQGVKEYTRAVNYFKTIYLKNKNKDYGTVYTDHAVQLARDMWTEGRLQEARTLLESTLSTVNQSSTLDQVYWVLGRMKQEDRKYDEAVAYFDKALGVNEDKDFALKLKWLVAWNLKREKKAKESIPILKELAKLAEKQQSDGYLYKAKYWQAQALKEAGETSDYKDLLEEISDDNFFGYYGRLSSLELGEVKKFETQKIKEDSDSVKIDNDLFDKIKLFKMIEERDVLSSFIQHNWRKLSKSQRSSYAFKKSFAYYYHYSELYKQNQQFIEIFSYDDKLDLFAEHPVFFFPYPYNDLIKTHTGKFNVPQEMVYSLMRQESLFDPKARSPADAFGLLQLIPRIAKLNEKETGIRVDSPEDLYEPSVIIPLGVSHISRLIGNFKGSLMLTAASYNAGNIPVRGWLKSREIKNVFEFVEDIPYSETETYAKLVFRNLSFYSLFNAETSASEKIAFLKNYFVLNNNLLVDSEHKN